MDAQRCWLAAGLLALPMAAGAADVKEIFSKGDAKWSDLQADTSAGTVAAAHMLGITGDAVATVENVKGLTTSLTGLSTNGSRGTLALGITPARTSFAPMNLSTYAGNGSLNGTLARIVGSTGFGYAQGTAKLNGADFDRRAVSLQTGWYLHDRDDPVLALAEAVRSNACGFPLKSEPPTGLPPAPPPAPAASGTAGSATTASTEETAGAAKATEAKDAAAIKERFADCRKVATQGLKWNRSMAALSVSRGWARRSDGTSPEMSMGTAWTANLTLGFNPPIGWLEDGAALTLGHRRTRGEPVLTTLLNGTPTQRNTALTLVRFAGGSDKARLFVEASTARKADLTESHRSFKHAVGLDLQLVPEVWLNLRVGRQHAINGDKQETGSLLSLSWSPKALMDVGFGK